MEANRKKSVPAVESSYRLPEVVLSRGPNPPQGRLRALLWHCSLESPWKGISAVPYWGVPDNLISRLFQSVLTNVSSWTLCWSQQGRLHLEWMRPHCQKPQKVPPTHTSFPL